MVSLPSEDIINVLLIDQLRELCSKLNLHYESKNRPSTLRKKLIEVKKGKSKKTTKDKQTTSKQKKKNKTANNKKRNEIRKKRKRKKPESDTESDTDSDIQTQTQPSRKKLKTNFQINESGLPNESYHPKIDFHRKNKRSIDFNAKLVSKWSQIHIHYRNSTKVAVVSDITIESGLSTYNNKPILGEMSITWNDKKYKTTENPKGVCLARFDVLTDGTPQGFDFLTFITGSSEYTKYQATKPSSIAKGNQLYKQTKNGKLITPLESTHAATIKNAIDLINDLVQEEQVTKSEIIQLFEESKHLNQMLSGEFFDSE
eukprot:247671_1